MILSAQTIRRLCLDRDMVRPYHPRTPSQDRTFGLSSCGYDIRLARDVWLWPYWGRLAFSIEHFKMPNDVMAEVKDKSTNARQFIFVQNTVIEPGWHGYLTLELTRFLPWPVKLRRGMPIAQIVFKRLDEPTEKPYRGKYQNQRAAPVAAKMEK